MLPERDQTYLSERWVDRHELITESQVLSVVLRDFRLPDGFLPSKVDLLLRLLFGFPESQPDMFWVSPKVTLHGRAPAASEVYEIYHGRQWQRFSRHLPADVWRPGVDGLQSYIALIGTMLSREAAVERAAA